MSNNADFFVMQLLSAVEQTSVCKNTHSLALQKYISKTTLLLNIDDTHNWLAGCRLLKGGKEHLWKRRAYTFAQKWAAVTSPLSQSFSNQEEPKVNSENDEWKKGHGTIKRRSGSRKIVLQKLKTCPTTLKMNGGEVICARAEDGDETVISRTDNGSIISI